MLGERSTQTYGGTHINEMLTMEERNKIRELKKIGHLLASPTGEKMASKFARKKACNWATAKVSF